ncbi:MAG: rod shape-determining protein MreC [Actinomycetota bacterium]|nr:rod shape-determining protein MreC [Actinomycetota bacterium]
MYDRKVIRRRRAALALFVGLSLVMLSAYFGEGPSGLLHGVQRGAQEVLSPVESGASKVFKPFRDLFNWVGDAFDANSENKKLKKELAQARTELAKARTATHENEQLRKLVGLHREEGFPQDTDPVTARVIARSSTDWSSTIQINKGTDDGVRPDQPVITGDGLVGKIAQASGGTATVELITDGESAVSAAIVPDGASGVVRTPVGDPQDLQLDFVRKSTGIRKGQTVITSGFKTGRLESLYPRGIPIGTVRAVDRDELETYQRVHVDPFADFRRIDIVQVLTGGEQ